MSQPGNSRFLTAVPRTTAASQSLFLITLLPREFHFAHSYSAYFRFVQTFLVSVLGHLTVDVFDSFDVFDVCDKFDGFDVLVLDELDVFDKFDEFDVLDVVYVFDLMSLMCLI